MWDPGLDAGVEKEHERKNKISNWNLYLSLEKYTKINFVALIIRLWLCKILTSLEARWYMGTATMSTTSVSLKIISEIMQKLKKERKRDKEGKREDGGKASMKTLFKKLVSYLFPRNFDLGIKQL